MGTVPVVTDDRRIKIVYVSFRVWLDSLMHDRAVKCVNMPRDAKIVRAETCAERMGRDVVMWIASPDFPEVQDGALLEEYRLEFQLLRDEPAVTELAASLRALLEWSQAEYQSNGEIDARAKAALDAYEATFVKVEL